MGALFPHSLCSQHIFFLKTLVLVQNNHICIQDFSFLSPQTKNGDSLPSSVTPRVQRNPQASSKHPSPESEAAEQKALLTVQYSLLKILSKSLAALRHFTPDVCQILLDQVGREERCCSPKGGVSSISRDILGLCVLLDTVTPLYTCLLFCTEQEGRRQGICLGNQALHNVKGRLG